MRQPYNGWAVGLSYHGKPQIIHSRIANADIHGFRIANSEKLGELGTGGIVIGKSGLSAQSYHFRGR